MLSQVRNNSENKTLKVNLIKKFIFNFYLYQVT